MPELSDLASAELSAAVDAVVAGDANAERYAHDIRRIITGVNSASAKARDTATALFEDDVMNPAGRARKLVELPNELLAQTAEQLDQAELLLDLVEGAHLTAILRHDGRDDANRREELHNYVVNLKQKDAVTTIVGLAANPRYATLLAGPMGDSLAARFSFDAAVLRTTALKSLGDNGTQDQIARSAALNALKNVRRVIGLARGGRDQVVANIKRGPAPKPSAALMS
jgi:hypothetical protein